MYPWVYVCERVIAQRSPMPPLKLLVHCSLFLCLFRNHWDVFWGQSFGTLVEPPLETCVSRVRVPGFKCSASLLFQLPTDVHSGRQQMLGRLSSAWISVHYLGHSDGVPGSWFLPNANWQAARLSSEPTNRRCLSVCVCACFCLWL